MVMAESFDCWKEVKCKNGYNRFYDEWWRRDLESLAKVCRSHPSVVMYSIGNEIPEQAKEETPFNCPKCGRKMCVLDDDFNEYVTSVLFVD